MNKFIRYVLTLCRRKKTKPVNFSVDALKNIHHGNLLEYLKEGGDPNARIKSDTLLSKFNYSAELTQALFAAGADANLSTGGISAFQHLMTHEPHMHYGVYTQQKDMVKFYIEHGADCQARTHLGESFVTLVCRLNGSADVLELLLRQGVAADTGDLYYPISNFDSKKAILLASYVEMDKLLHYRDGVYHTFNDKEKSFYNDCVEAIVTKRELESNLVNSDKAPKKKVNKL